MAAERMNFPLNLTFPYYYFETFLMSRDVNSPRRSHDFNKDGRQYAGELNLTLT